MKLLSAAQKAVTTGGITVTFLPFFKHEDGTLASDDHLHLIGINVMKSALALALITNTTGVNAAASDLHNPH